MDTDRGRGRDSYRGRGSRDSRSVSPPPKRRRDYTESRSPPPKRGRRYS
jgi:pre-mRNA-splicing factor CWC22